MTDDFVAAVKKSAKRATFLGGLGLFVAGVAAVAIRPSVDGQAMVALGALLAAAGLLVSKYSRQSDRHRKVVVLISHD